MKDNLTKILLEVASDIAELKETLSEIKNSQLQMTRRLDSLDITLKNTRSLLREKEREKELEASFQRQLWHNQIQSRKVKI